MKIKAIVFDLDGTLVDTEKYNFYAWQKFLQMHGHDIDLETYAKKFVGQSKDYIAKECAQLTGINFGAIIAEKDIYFEEFLAKEPITEIPGAKALLEKLTQRNFLLACATSGDRAETTLKLNTLDFAKYFKSIITGDDVQNPKPDPEVYLNSIKNLGVKAGEAIAVEDTLTGFQSAAAAGLRTFIVKTDMNKFISFPTEDIIDGLPAFLTLLETLGL